MTELEAAQQTARENVPPASSPDDYGATRSHASECKNISAPGLIWYGAEPPPPPRYLIANLLPESGLATLAGQFSVGKTFIGAAIAAAVMTGFDFAGETVMRKGAVLWLAAEGENAIEGRVRAAVERLCGNAGPQPFARQAGGVPGLKEAGALEKLTALADVAASHAREKFDLPLVLIILDTLSAAAGFDDENNASEVQKAMTIMRELSRASGALVLPIDHHGKSDDTGIRGSSAKGAAVDAILSALGGAAEGKVKNRRLVVSKLREGASGRVIHFELVPVEGEFGSTCVVEWKPQRPPAGTSNAPAKAKRPSRSLITFLKALDFVLSDAGQRARPMSDGPEVLTADRMRVREEFMRSYPADNLSAKGEAFRRSEDSAIAGGLIGSRPVGLELGEAVFWKLRPTQ